MDRTRAGSAEAHAEFAGMFSKATGHESRRFLMPDAHKQDFVLALAECLNDRIDAVTNHPKNVRNTPADQRIHQDLCCRRVTRKMVRLSDDMRLCFAGGY